MRPEEPEADIELIDQVICSIIIVTLVAILSVTAVLLMRVYN